MTHDEMIEALAAAVTGGQVGPGIQRASPDLVSATVKIQADEQTLGIDVQMVPTEAGLQLENFSVSVYLRPRQKNTVGAYGWGVAKGASLTGGTKIHMIMPTTEAAARYTVACFVKLDAGHYQLWSDTKDFEFAPANLSERRG